MCNLTNKQYTVLKLNIEEIMQKFNNLDQLEQYLTRYSNNQKLQKGPNKLNKTVQLMHLIGDPNLGLKIIHLAGTSGKTSTASYLSKLLSLSGFKVGLTISPHMDIITERVQINNKPLSTKIFLKEISIFLNLIKNSSLKFGYFEILFAFSLYYFKKIKADYVIVETGVGGLLDPTNVISDKLAVITDIGLDHMEFLGNTISKIAFQKVGIVKTKNKLIMFQQSKTIMKVIQKRIAEKNAQLILAKKIPLDIKVLKSFKALPYYQQRNWMLALNVYSYLSSRDKFKTISNNLLLESFNYQIPGRMDQLDYLGQKIIFDGAHNPQKMRSFLTSFKKLYPNKKAVFLLAFKKDKNFSKMLDYLLPVAEQILLCSFNFKQDYHIYSVHPKEIQKYLNAKNFSKVTIFKDQKEALKRLSMYQDNLKIVTGSLYIVAQIRSIILKNQN